MRVTRSKDCGNSPKNTFTQEFAVALLSGQAKKLSSWATEDIECVLHDATTLDGRAALIAAFCEQDVFDAASAKITHVISHGKAAAVNGILKDGRSVEHPFCFFFEFATAKADTVNKVFVYVNH